VRKVGNRPESPTTKLRTILERRKEETSKAREDRANRRRRITDGSSSGAEDPDQGVVSCQEEIACGGDEARKPMPGPGEDEEYESPPRPSQIRVKWHPGLEQTVPVIQLMPAAVRRPCLALNRKLDNLGNVSEAGLPVDELIREHIVVTKFVYDDDIQPDPKPSRIKRKKP